MHHEAWMNKHLMLLVMSYRNMRVDVHQRFHQVKGLIFCGEAFTMRFQPAKYHHSAREESFDSRVEGS